MPGRPPPLVAHILHRFDTGGLENGVVNLINHMPVDAYRHVIIALTEVTDFRLRLRRPDVDCVALHKPPGHGARLYPRLWRLLRQLRPAIVHTRNLAALEMQPAAWAAGVRGRVHGEHGRDVEDLDGLSVRHQRIRRLYAPFVQRHIALSRDLQGYLVQRVGIAPGRIEQIYNGVDSGRFHPATGGGRDRSGMPFSGAHVVFGTVGRMQTVKHQVLLARAFVQLVQRNPSAADRARLCLLGDGPLRPAVQAVLDEAGVADLAWLPGERSDVPSLMQALDVFVLPSLAEGISNTILEAMSCALPVVATAVGGNPELVDHEHTGLVVPSDDVGAMADAMLKLLQDERQRHEFGSAGRAEVERRFSVQAMVAAYQTVYDRILSNAAR